MPADTIAGLRTLPGVRSVSVEDREIAQMVTVQCSRPADVITHLSTLLDGVPLAKLSSRDPTLEDAYVQLIGESS